MRTLTLSSEMAPSIRRVLNLSRIDGHAGGIWWLDDTTVDTVRKACLLNILAVLAVTPTPEAPLITDVLAVFAVQVDRIYALMRTDVRETLEDFVADVRMPFYKDAGQPVAVHRELLEDLPEWIAAPGLQADGTRLTSFRAEGAPSLQIVLADSPYPYTVADIDLDAHNPLQDVVGFFGHMKELFRGRRTKRPTDHLALRKVLARGPAAERLGYTLDA